ncbi:hypothetical protein ACFFUB_01865 [Algimonas porphyrae]|uniref:Lipoprotein n=1 Tax=Algimonas porphyrae TaxID=1128113 RepID=A0ABQ5UZW3_9PROT|nr:hypothetical protein [Algimonas porphyrae]GLQ20786.1 hypothetical protein GCM10007854_17410 [Algimonas porphyrae]
MTIRFLTLAACAISLGACSTVVNGKNQLVQFDTGSVTGADCVAKGGSDFAVNKQFQTPADVKLPRSSKALNITCNKTGYQTASRTISGKVEGSTAGNLVLGGPIGVGVDALTGAIYKYPDTVSIPMDPLQPPTVTGEPIS